MHTQEIGFAVQKENGIVTRIGKSAICQPGTGSKGSAGSMGWHGDKPEGDTRDKNQKG